MLTITTDTTTLKISSLEAIESIQIEKPYKGLTVKVITIKTDSETIKLTEEN
jgi:hypothetical protein